MRKKHSGSRRWLHGILVFVMFLSFCFAMPRQVMAKASPITIRIVYNKTSVRVGEEIRVSYGINSQNGIDTVYCGWDEYTGGQWLTRAYQQGSAADGSSSYTPRIGTQVRFWVYVLDAAGVETLVAGRVITITDGTEVDPIKIKITCDPGSVNMGDEIIATYTISGGNGTYSAYSYYSWDVYTDKDGWTDGEERPITSASGTIRYRPLQGTRVRLWICAYDTDGRSGGEFGRGVNVYPAIFSAHLDGYDVDAAIGEKAVFKVRAVGNLLTYQWQWREDANHAWKNCSGATEGYNTNTLKVTAAAGRNGYQYRCRVQDVTGTTIDTYDATLNVYGLTKQPSSVNTTAGNTATFKITTIGQYVYYQWQWREDAEHAWKNSTSATEGYNSDTLKVTATNGRNGYQYRCVVSSNAGVFYSDAVTLNVLGITSQPSSVTKAIGNTAVFSIAASGTGLTYQWQWREDASHAWKNSSSATAGYNTNSLTVPAESYRNGYQYRCRVKDSAGTTVYSNAATLNVYGITSHPSSVSTVADKTVSFMVTAFGNGLTYQWQWREDADHIWKNSSSSTSGYNTATLKVPAASYRNGYQYRCRVKDSSGNTVYSDAAVLKVWTITSQPTSVSAGIGNNASFKVSANGSGLTYQWQWREDADHAWKNSSSSTTGYNTKTLTVSAELYRNGYQYRCRISDSGGNTVYSDAAALYVWGVTSQPSSVSTTVGNTATFKVAATGNGLTYQWQWREDTDHAWKNSSASTIGYNTAALKVTAESYRNGYQYRCKVTNSAGNTVYSVAATLKVQ